MMKKAGAAIFAAASLMMLGSPAFAAPGHSDGGHTAIGEAYTWIHEEEEVDHADQFGLINLNDSNVLSNINICNVEVLNIIPILSQNDESVCVNTDDDDNDDNDTHEGGHH